MPRLAKVANPEALDASDGARARMKVTVPSAWLKDGAELAITAPRLLSCDRCDGGGCDGCERSGAFRSHLKEEGRIVHMKLPPSTGDKGMVVRLVSPFEGSEIEQLLVRISIGDEPSKGVALIEKRVALATPTPQLALNPILVMVVVVAAIVLLALLIRAQ